METKIRQSPNVNDCRPRQSPPARADLPHYVPPTPAFSWQRFGELKHLQPKVPPAHPRAPSPAGRILCNPIRFRSRPAGHAVPDRLQMTLIMGELNISDVIRAHVSEILPAVAFSLGCDFVWASRACVQGVLRAAAVDSRSSMLRNCASLSVQQPSAQRDFFDQSGWFGETLVLVRS
jgi:hypothetical protein